MLKENELWEVVRNTTANPIVIPPSTDVTLLAAFNKKDIKAMRIILDAVKDHVSPHVSAKDYAHEMWSALIWLFQSTNENRKMVLREKLKNIKMVKGEVCMAYLTRISQVRDELAAVGVMVTGPELVRTTLNGATAPWAMFVQGLVARENYQIGTEYVMTLFRRLGGVSYSAVVILVGEMRTMWHSQRKGRRRARRVGPNSSKMGRRRI